MSDSLSGSRRGQEKKRQHYVPKVILRNFCHGERQIRCVDKFSGKTFTDSIDERAQEEFFYSPLVEGVRDHYIEEWLCDAEGELGNAFAEILVNRYWPVSPETKMILGQYAAVQWLRTPAAKPVHTEIARRMLASGEVGVTEAWRARFPETAFAADDSVVGLRDAYDRVSAPEGIERNDVPWGNVLAYASAAGKSLASREMLLVVTEDQAFMTSDIGMAMANSENFLGHDGDLEYLFAGKNLYFPISRSAAIIISSWPGNSPDEVVYNDARLVGGINHAIFAGARRWIFIHPEDNILIPAQRSGREKS